MTYTLKVADPGRVADGDVQVCDRLPSRLTYVGSDPRARAAAGGYCWGIATLDAHASRSFTITATAKLGGGARVSNVATATGYDLKTVRARATITVLPFQRVGCSLRTTPEIRSGGRSALRRPDC